MKIVVGILAVSFVAVTLLTTWEGGFAVLFGWIPYLGQVVPKVSADRGSVAVGVVAVLLFAMGIHALGKTWQRQRSAKVGMATSTWRIRSTLAIVSMVLVLFTAGISIIGMVHQTTWLVRSDRSLYGDGVKNRGGSPIANLKMISLGMTGYHDTKGEFPAGGTFAPDGTMLHSWESYSLPWIGYSSRDIDMDKPWNDPVNQKYFKCIIPEFINPEFRTADLEDREGYGLSHYAANSHVMGANKSMKFADIQDGAANTLLIGEVNSQFKPWGHPVNWRDPMVGINRGPRSFGGPPGSSGANFVMADGSIRFLTAQIDPDVLRALSTPNGNEEIREMGWQKR